jgi:predicted ATPase
MGLHTGPAELVEGDYAVSHTLNRAARVMSAGFGGQILLSQEASNLVVRQLPEGIEILDLGEHRLKGLHILEHLYQIRAPGLPEDFPRLPTAVAYKHNLPAQLTSFVGRETEIADLSEKVKSARLVTLTGAGGTGKTRLSHQVAQKVLDSFPDGVWLVELAPLSDPALVPHACLQALELVQQPGASPATILAQYLESKHALLILDNCEHMLTACSSLTNTLLKSCPQLHILASSREILSIPGEISFRVPSLTFPDPRRLPSLDEMRQFEAVILFEERAKQALPGFRLSAESVAAVALICLRLDGIPLAIELAAALIHVMTVDQLASRLNNTFRILTGGSKAVLPRQQTLKATIDWSYDLLSPNERLLLQRLSVFAGGWMLDAAESVCSDEEGSPNAISSLDVIGLLAQLVDKSLVIAVIHKDGGRYHLLETIRQYARDRLMETGRGVAVRNRHLAYFAQLSAEAQPHLRAKGMLEWLDRLDLELDNLRVALEWSCSSHIEVGLKIATDLLWFWHIRALFEEVVALLEILLRAEVDDRHDQALSGQRALQRARGLHALAHFLAYFTSHPLTSKRIELCQESIAILRGLGQSARHDLAISLLKLLWVQGNLDQPSPLRKEMLEIFENEKNAFYLSEFYWLQNGSILSSKGKFVDAEDLLEKSLALSKEIGDLDGMMSRSGALSDLAWYKADDLRADSLLQDAIRFGRMVKNRWNEPEYQLALGNRALARGEYLEAARLARESLRQYRELNYSIGVNKSLDNLQRTVWSQGDLEESIRVGQERLEPHSERNADPMNFFQLENTISAYLYQGRAMISRGDLPQAKTLLNKALGSILSEGHMNWWRLKIEFLLAWIAFFTQLGDYSHAARLIGAVDSMYQPTKVSYSPRERQEHLENLGACRAALGEETYWAVFVDGRALTLEHAIGWIASAM